MLRRTWASDTGGSRGERKHSIAPREAWTFVNPTYSVSARLVKLYSNYMCDFVLFCLVAVVSRRFLPVIYCRGVRFGACSCLFNIYIYISFGSQPLVMPLPVSVYLFPYLI